MHKTNGISAWGLHILHILWRKLFLQHVEFEPKLEAIKKFTEISQFARGDLRHQHQTRFRLVDGDSFRGSGATANTRCQAKETHGWRGKRIDRMGEEA